MNEKRREGESFTDYRNRMRKENADFKVCSAPFQLWNSSQGRTYNAKKYGLIGDVVKTGSQKRAEKRLKKEGAV